MSRAVLRNNVVFFLLGLFGSSASARLRMPIRAEYLESPFTPYTAYLHVYTFLSFSGYHHWCVIMS